MKIDISQSFVNADDTAAVDAKTGEPITLKTVLINALLQDGGPATPAEEKIKRYSLYRDVKKSEVGFVQWSVEDVSLVKKAIAASYPTLVLGQAYAMIESNQ